MANSYNISRVGHNLDKDHSLYKPPFDFIFEWDNGMTSEVLYDLSSGTYRVKITDGNGCSVYGSYDVQEPEELTASIFVEQPSSIENGNIDLSVHGGPLPYTYTWNTYS